MERTKRMWGWLDVVLLLITLIPLGYALAVYDQLPEMMTTHFTFSGEANGYQEKPYFLLYMSLLTIGVPLLMKVTRRLDPKRENYEKFAGAYELMRVALTVFLSVIYAVTISYNLGHSLNIQRIVLLMLGVLFMLMGNYLGRIRHNYFVGVRTPWTLANEDVWRKTHRFAAPLFVGAGVVAVIAAFLPGAAAMWLFLAAIAVAAGLPFWYSYWVFRNLGRR